MKTKLLLLSALLILFIANSYAQPGDDCSNAVDLGGQTSPISNTTVGAANDFSFCSMGSAADKIVYYDLPNGSTITIQQTVNNYDSRHSLRYGGACPGAIEIVCTDDSDLKVETWKNCTGSTQRVYWIQSGFSSNEGTFTLAWTVVAGTCPAPTCSDGIMNQGETGIDCGGPCPACPLSIDNGDQTLCSGSFTDSGASGSYSNSENYTATYCSDNGQAINFTFSSFDSESLDHLLIYNGTNASAPLLLDLNGHSVTTPFIISSSNPSNCLTFVFTSDGSVTYSGWEAAISCGVIIGTCSDGLMNQDETGVDCGGLTCPACPTIGACGNLSTNDFCSDPGTLTQGTGNWNNTTTGSYTSDLPANINSVFCGSIENNSWYQFTALATTESFVFSAVGGAACGSGIQVEIYDVTTDGNGCCTNFTSVSNCFNPASQTGGTVTATGLTIGNSYYMMIDGNAGAGCDFTVANWDVSLPVQLLSFEGYNYKGGNKLLWKTASEINNDYFIVQKSTDTKTYTDLGIIDGNGNSNTTIEYDFIDESSTDELSYYRLKQIDFDGKYKYSKIIVLQLSNGDQEINIYPNPSTTNFSFDISTSNNEVYTISYTNITGTSYHEKINITEGTNTYQVNNFVELPNGIYFVQILNENGAVIKAQKVIKR